MKLRALLFSLLFTSISFTAFALGADETPKVYKYWVQLKDKNNTPYSVSRPTEFLSQKAIDRRKKNNIAITEQDFPVNPNYLKQIRSIKGVTVLNTSRWFNTITVAVEDDNTMIQFDKLPFVVNSKLLSITPKSDKQYGDKRPLSLGDMPPPPPMNTPGDELVEQNNYAGAAEDFYGKAKRQIEMLNGIKVHNSGFTGYGVTVAVIDAGFYQANNLVAFRRAFATQQILATWDFVMGNEYVYEDNSHGMSVLSCMLAREEGRMVGTAPDAHYYLLRSEDADTEYPIEEANWVSAAEYADSAGVDVINSSLGYTQYDDTMFSYKYIQLDGKTTIITRAADIAAGKGIIVCNAAGNSGNKTWKYIGAPADANNILAVGAVNEKEEKANFSSFGPTADGRMKPDLAAMGLATIVVTPTNKYLPGNGTSYASPVLCGLVACLVQGNPKATSASIINAIIMSCDRYPLANPELGNGIPDFYLAHTMLGNANDFDYTKNQFVEFYTDSTDNQFLIYNYYSATAQKVTVEIVRKKEVVASFNLELAAKSFNKKSLDQFTTLDKKGNYTFIMKDEKGNVIAEKYFSK